MVYKITKLSFSKAKRRTYKYLLKTMKKQTLRTCTTKEAGGIIVPGRQTQTMTVPRKSGRMAAPMTNDKAYLQSRFFLSKSCSLSTTSSNSRKTFNLDTCEVHMFVSASPFNFARGVELFLCFHKCGNSYYI